MATTCPFCGAPEELDLFEIWGDHSFQIQTCCLARHEQVVAEMNEDPSWAAELISRLGANAFGQVRRIGDEAGQMVIDYQLRLVQVSQGRAKSFVRQHHAHCPKPPPGWRWGHGIANGPSLLGVAFIGRPVARMIDPVSTVEVNRLCIRRDLPSPLRWNACSMIYGAAAREARRRGYSRIITYVLEDEEAVTLRAAGWTCEGPAGGGSWDRTSRRREDAAPTVAKVRWSRVLRA